VKIEISPGEVVDRLSILEIKLERIAEPGKRERLRPQYEALLRACVELKGIEALAAELKEVNEALWQIEDALRDHEHRGDFGPAFIALARSVYQKNDRRSVIKRQIDDHFDSALSEEKSYAAY
jgi:hypothetical protein